MNPRIRFSHIWDKLAEPEWTTIRSWNEEKETYYRGMIGCKFTAMEQKWGQNGRFICYVYLADVEVIAGQLIPDNLLRKDVTLNGMVNGSWYRKIRQMPKTLVLKFSNTPITQSRLEEVIEMIDEDEIEYDRIVREHNETQYIGPVCKNCGHVIAFLVLVHCKELDCDCIEPEALK